MDVHTCPECGLRYDTEATGPHECPIPGVVNTADADGDGLCDTCGSDVDED